MITTSLPIFPIPCARRTPGSAQSDISELQSRHITSATINRPCHCTVQHLFLHLSVIDLRGMGN